jgi:copper homeostasis protein (lipoprotein)
MARPNAIHAAFVAGVVASLVVGCQGRDAATAKSAGANDTTSVHGGGIGMRAPAEAADTFRVTLPLERSRQRLVGMYSYMADAGVFVRCDTGDTVVVAQQGDNAALERAYSATEHETGAPVLVTVDGRIEPRPPMEGTGMRNTLIVDRFDRVWPEETCEKATVETPLTNTYWKLAELNGTSVHPGPGQKEAHLMLRTGEPRVNGFGGCSEFTGAYEVAGATIHFLRVAATTSTCPEHDRETEFLAALEGVTHYEILGETLLLMSDTGVAARFRAVYFR